MTTHQIQSMNLFQTIFLIFIHVRWVVGYRIHIWKQIVYSFPCMHLIFINFCLSFVCFLSIRIFYHVFGCWELYC